ncbi:MAG: COX15/CtaA family protein [Verrucomicrobia bacterium]|nr:COX15/CtaA family protein [Verrucomicrobiota bacterium]
MYSLGLYRFAKAVVFATLSLILLGGMVTSLGGGLSVPDWPTTFGYNMFTFPFSQWQGLVFWEHIHRLAAALVGALTVLLAIGILRKESRPWVRGLGVGAVALVILQGIMGGLRVTELSTPLAILHGCVAQGFLCVVTVTALALSPQWPQVQKDPRVPSGFVRWNWALVAVVSIQLVLGAVMRHLHAGLAIPTFPLTPEGTVFPVVHNKLVDIAFAHRVWAVVVALVTAIVIGKAIPLAREGRHPAFLERSAVALVCLLGVQLTLGAWIIWFYRPPLPTSLHVLNGALLLMTALTLAVKASRAPRA